MNTNLPLVLRTSDGLTWSNGWAGSGAYSDMIGKEYKKDQEWEKKGGKNGKRKGQERHWNGVKNGF